MNVPANAANKPANGQAAPAVPATPASAPAQPSYQELLARIAELEKQQSQPKGQLSMMVSEKGAIQVNGFGRFPWTPYREQAEKVGLQIYGLTQEQFNQSPIGQFIAANDAKLSRKADKAKAGK